MTIGAVVEAMGLLLSDDLIFNSRILGTARDLGLSVRAVRKSSELLDQARKAAPACVIVDLANPGLQMTLLMDGLNELGVRVIAYGPHVDVAGLRAAREAGCEVVLPRSKFVEELPGKLAEWFQARS